VLPQTGMAQKSRLIVQLKHRARYFQLITYPIHNGQIHPHGEDPVAEMNAFRDVNQ